MSKKLKVLLVVFNIVTLLGVYYLGLRHGFVQGVDFLYNQCYNIGGVVLDERGYAMECGPVGPVPKEELEQAGLDKKTEMWYTRNINTL